MYKKGKTEIGWPVVALVVAALVLFYPQIQTFFGPAAPVTPPVAPDAGLICPVDTTTLGFSAEDVDNPGTAVNILSRYWVEDLPQGEVNTSTTTTVSPGDTLEVWFASSSATYYGSVFNSNADVPCKGTYDIAGKLWNKDSAVSMTVYDEDNDQAQTGAANNQSLGIGEQVEMRLRVKGNHEEYFGNPEVSLENVLTVEYLKTEIDSVKVTKDGVELGSASVPVVETVSNVNNAEIGFLFPKIAGSTNVDYLLIINADDLNDPSADILLKMYDSDYFYNSDTGAIDTGWEDQSNADIGEANEPTATAYIS